MIYYNEIDKNAVAWLGELMERDIIPRGDIDDRSIELVQPGDVAGYTQCHFFAGIGVWAYAGRLAGLPDDYPWWSGSCPCQPFSVSGKRRGTADPRHLWPHLFRLIRACRPSVVMGEQVAQKAGWNWFNGVRSDLAAEAYQCRGVGLCSCAVDSPDERERIYWCAVAERERAERRPYFASGRQSVASGNGNDADFSLADSPGKCRERERTGRAGSGWGQLADRGHDAVSGYRSLVDGPRIGRREGWSEPSLLGGRGAATGADAPCEMGHGDGTGLPVGISLFDDAREERAAAGRTDDATRNASWYADHEWIACHDGKKRRAKPGTSMLVAGSPGRIPMWRGLGGSINAQLASEVIKAFVETVAP